MKVNDSIIFVAVKDRVFLNKRQGVAKKKQFVLVLSEMSCCFCVVAVSWSLVIVLLLLCFSVFAVVIAVH